MFLPIYDSKASTVTRALEMVHSTDRRRMTLSLKLLQCSDHDPRMPNTFYIVWVPVLRRAARLIGGLSTKVLVLEYPLEGPIW